MQQQAEDLLRRVERSNEGGQEVVGQRRPRRTKYARPLNAFRSPPATINAALNAAQKASEEAQSAAQRAEQASGEFTSTIASARQATEEARGISQRVE